MYNLSRGSYMSTDEYNVYIDESGDEGINRGSKFFILTALVVKKQNDLATSKKVDIIKENLELDIKKQLHWKLIKGYPNKIMIMKTISELDVKIINIIIDTTTIKLIPSNGLYYYFSGYLYERICWLMKDLNGVANVIVSSRGNLSKESLFNYINHNNNKKFKIQSDLIKEIKIIPNERKKLLQLADCCCSALYQALTYDNEKHYQYIGIIKNNLYVKSHNLVGYGMKLVPSDSNSKEFSDLIKYLKSNY